jgi:hypothetical protein
METNKPQIGNILYHQNSGVSFKYLGDFKPQFSTEKFVELLNLKSGKVERFMKKTYLQYFKIVEE